MTDFISVAHEGEPVLRPPAPQRKNGRDWTKWLAVLSTIVVFVTLVIIIPTAIDASNASDTATKIDNNGVAADCRSRYANERTQREAKVTQSLVDLQVNQALGLLFLVQDNEKGLLQVAAGTPKLIEDVNNANARLIKAIDEYDAALKRSDEGFLSTCKKRFP